MDWTTNQMLMVESKMSENHQLVYTKACIIYIEYKDARSPIKYNKLAVYHTEDKHLHVI